MRAKIRGHPPLGHGDPVLWVDLNPQNTFQIELINLSSIQTLKRKRGEEKKKKKKERKKKKRGGGGGGGV